MHITYSKPITRGIREGFTLVDLIIVTAVISILAGLLLPALSATQNASHGMFCVSNKRQLILAFSTYATDNAGRFPGNLHGGVALNPDGLSASDKALAPWAVGWLDWTVAQANTNATYLTNPRYTKLSPYYGNRARVVRCPADRYLSAVQKRAGWNERVRSVSANIGVGSGNAEAGPWDTYFTHAQKYSDLVKPSPADVWVYLDEHPDSINDPAFFNPTAGRWVDLPASYHDGAGSFAFADGSAGLHRWQASAKGIRVSTSDINFPVAKPGDVDVAWMRDHASHR